MATLTDMTAEIITILVKSLKKTAMGCVQSEHLMTFLAFLTVFHSLWGLGLHFISFFAGKLKECCFSGSWRKIENAHTHSHTRIHHETHNPIRIVNFQCCVQEKARQPQTSRGGRSIWVRECQTHWLRGFTLWKINSENDWLRSFCKKKKKLLQKILISQVKFRLIQQGQLKLSQSVSR